MTVPTNTTATPYVPARDPAKITENGRPAGKAEGIRFLRMEADAAVFALASGNYQFIVEP